MIRRMSKSQGVMARFGWGTTRIAVYALKSRFGGQLELTQCIKSKISGPVSKDDVVPGTEKIVLDFSSIQSLDVLINRLQQLRAEILE